MKKQIFLIAIMLLQTWQASDACTSAVISGRVTPDGRPILWKNRDTSTDQNCVKYFAGEKYPFVAVVNSASDNPRSIWIGTNSTGFSVMNTLSYNLKDEKDESGSKNNGTLMLRALEICTSVEDFRVFLDTLSKPMFVSANFGVIDAKGGAAYFEVDDTSAVMFDVNDPKIAPFGYLTRTNFSFSGFPEKGAGYIRYQQADLMFHNASATGEITPEWIFNELSRAFINPMLGINLKDGSYNRPKTNGWFVEQDFIPRRSSTCSVAIQGVKPDENPELTTMWTIIGYPPVTPAIPVWVAGGEKLPSLLTRDSKTAASPLCDKALTLRNKVYSYTRGNKDFEKYFHWELLFNNAGTGYIQKVKEIEDAVFTATQPILEKWRKEGKIRHNELQELYDNQNAFVTRTYLATFGL